MKVTKQMIDAVNNRAEENITYIKEFLEVQKGKQDY